MDTITHGIAGSLLTRTLTERPARRALLAGRLPEGAPLGERSARLDAADFRELLIGCRHLNAKIMGTMPAAASATASGSPAFVIRIPVV